jgi:hypothetical protein
LQDLQQQWREARHLTKHVLHVPGYWAADPGG